MWIRWRKNYGAGDWTHWHETIGTKDSDPTRCGCRPTVSHLEATETSPKLWRCGNCDRWGNSKPQRVRAKGHR